MIKIFSGSQYYCSKRFKELFKEGWKLSKINRWSDGKFTYLMTKDKL